MTISKKSRKMEIVHNPFKDNEILDAKRRFLDAKERYALEEMELKEDLAMRGFSYGRLFGHEVAPPKRGKKKEGCAQQ